MASFGRKLSFFLIVPLTTFVVLVLITAVLIANYQSQHNGRIYTGVNIWGIDLSQMTTEQAEQTLLANLPHAQEETFTFTDPQTEQTWVHSSRDLGMSFELAATVDQAMLVGRQGAQTARLIDIFETWYYGRSLAPILIFDESKLDTVLGQLAADIAQPAVNANLQLDGNKASYIPGRLGKQLDMTDTLARLKTPVSDFRSAEIELLVHDTLPAIHDTADASQELQQALNGDVTFYLEMPLDEMDLLQVVLPQDLLQSWLRIDLVEGDDGRLQHQANLDENALRQWLEPYAEQLYREPVNARFYFDDDTKELVLVAPHINGRSLDIEATIDYLQHALTTPDRIVPFAVQDIVPVVHSGAKAEDLGITELVSENTTWFYGSTDARKHNIARSAANFFGIVIAPGEEFSFNKYLGSVSEDDGYEEGLIIFGGRTIKGMWWWRCMSG